MPDDETTGRRHQPTAYWMIARYEAGRTEVLTVDRDGESSLPVFGFEEEARMFLRLGGFERDGWQLGGSTAGELASMLASEFWPGVGSVVLDPLPEVVDRVLGAGTLTVTASRKSFVDCLHGNRELLAP